jgi:hypothetical protein
MTRLLLILVVLAVALTAAPPPLFADAACDLAQEICHWYEEQSGEYCDYVWCMQDHIRMGLISWDCLYGQAQFQLTFC